MASTEQGEEIIEDLEPKTFNYDENSDGRVKVVPYAQVRIYGGPPTSTITRIDSFEQTSKFLPGDRVWYQANGSGPREGPYIVAHVASPRKYQLAAINDVSVLVLAGRIINENELEEAKI